MGESPTNRNSTINGSQMIDKKDLIWEKEKQQRKKEEERKQQSEVKTGYKDYLKEERLKKTLEGNASNSTNGNRKAMFVSKNLTPSEKNQYISEQFKAI